VTALSTESLTALAACDLNAAALTCGGDTTEKVEVLAAQGPSTPVPVAVPTPMPARSAATGVVAAASALFAVPVAVANALVLSKVCTLNSTVPF
jgi:hypothetical protein